MNYLTLFKGKTPFNKLWLLPAVVAERSKSSRFKFNHTLHQPTLLQQHYKHTHKDQQDTKVPRHSFLAKDQTAGSELLFFEADPHITKLAWSSDVG